MPPTNEQRRPGGGGAAGYSRQENGQDYSEGGGSRQPASGGGRKLRLFKLWERTSERTGRTYLSGLLGDLSLIAFSDTKEHPKRPGERVTVWTVLAEERDPSRRPG